MCVGSKEPFKNWVHTTTLVQHDYQQETHPLREAVGAAPYKQLRKLSDCGSGSRPWISLHVMNTVTELWIMLIRSPSFHTCQLMSFEEIEPSQNQPNEKHWSAKPSVQQCIWLYLRVDKKSITVSWLSHACLAHCFVPAHAKFAHEFLALFHRPCATYL